MLSLTIGLVITNFHENCSIFEKKNILPMKNCTWKMYYTISYHEGLGRKQTLADKKKNGGQWTSNASDKLALELCLSILQKSLAVQRHKLLQVNCSREGIESSWEAYCNVIGSSKVKWKRRVICSAHWSSRKIQMPEDLPDIKHASVSNDKDTTFGRWHWNCAATLWNNSWRTPGLHN